MVVDNGMIQSFLNGVPHFSMKALQDLHYNRYLRTKDITGINKIVSYLNNIHPYLIHLPNQDLGIEGQGWGAISYDCLFLTSIFS